MNKKITLLAILLLATVSSIFSVPQLSDKTTISIADYKNRNMGEPIPEWVKQLAMGNYRDPNIFTEVPNFDKHKNDEIFITSMRGNDFAKLIIETENDLKYEYSSIIQKKMGKAMASKNNTYHEPMESLTPTITTDNHSKFSLLSTSKITEDANHFLQNMSCVSKRVLLRYT